MASEITYYDSDYNYISPVRHFKANDPYYYEVDNIPIKQLEESSNFLKDQIDGLLNESGRNLSIDRAGFKELKPFVTGRDRKVRINAGRYTARVNDAYSITPLQKVTQVLGFSNTVDSNGEVADTNQHVTETINGTTVSAALNTFQEGVAGDALNMNGLAERTFTYPINDEDGVSNGVLNATSISDYITKKAETGFSQVAEPLLPNFIGKLYLDNVVPGVNEQTLQAIRNVYTPGVDPDASQSNRLESDFIKRWRGAIRTSIVDVSGELSVTVPDFNEEEFFYLDETGEKQQLTASQRIDLVFIYSKAIDQNETTIASPEGDGSYTKLNVPTLGILKGAGIGVSRKRNSTESPNDEVTLMNTAGNIDGVPLMLAHPGDENGEYTGFESSTVGTIRGSFPSPDDLLNLAPVLSENLESDSVALIGQSILPVAYVRVTNAGGVVDILEDADIIDIRPFFRTTELAYNERAGIAAATPQISISNPVVTESHLEKVRKEIYGDLKNRIDGIGPIPPAAPSRVVGVGQVCGGMRYGPEGALLRQAAGNILGQQTWSELADTAENFFNYMPGSISLQPSWDPADWALARGDYGQTRPGDHINVCWPLAAESNNPENDFLPPYYKQTDMSVYTTPLTMKTFWQSNSEFSPSLHSYGVKPVDVTAHTAMDHFRGGKHQRQNVVIHYVKKLIRINRENVPWMVDYSVNAKLLNCIPISTGNDVGKGPTGRAAAASNVWVNKTRDYFVINVAWVADDAISPGHYGLMENAGAFPWTYRNDARKYAGFALPEIPIPTPGEFQQYNTQTRINRGESGIGPGDDEQGDVFLSQVNTGAPAANQTEFSYFKNVTPILYPTVEYEIIGHNNSMTQQSPRVSSMAAGNTPTITLI